MHGEMEDGTLNLNFQRETNVDENGNFIDTLNLKSSRKTMAEK